MRAKSSSNNHLPFYQRQLANGKTIFANLSRSHPDHGCSPQEHAKRKARRDARELRFLPKSRTYTL